MNPTRPLSCHNEPEYDGLQEINLLLEEPNPCSIEVREVLTLESDNFHSVVVKLDAAVV